MDLNVNTTGTPGYNVVANPTLFVGAFLTSGFDFRGRMAELLIYDGILNTADRDAVQSYLIARAKTFSVTSDNPVIMNTLDVQETVNLSSEGTVTTFDGTIGKSSGTVGTVTVDGTDTDTVIAIAEGTAALHRRVW